MTAIEEEASRFIDDIAVLTPYTRVTKEAKRKLAKLIEAREAALSQQHEREKQSWWVEIKHDDATYTRVLGPFSTATDAGTARSYIELKDTRDRNYQLIEEGSELQQQSNGGPS